MVAKLSAASANFLKFVTGQSADIKEYIDRRAFIAVGPFLILMFPSLSAGENGPSPDRVTTTIERRLIDVADMFSLYVLGGGVGKHGLSVSPDGKSVAFQMPRANVEENNYTAGWYVLDLTKKAEPIHVGNAGNPLLFRSKNRLHGRTNGSWVSTLPVWSPDGQWIAYRRMDGNSIQVWRSRVDGTVQEQLTQSEVSVDAFWWSDDGQKIWFETDVKPKEKAEYLQQKWENGLWASTPNFRPLSSTYEMTAYEVNSGQPELWVLNVSSRQVRRASDSDTESSAQGRPRSDGMTASYDGELLAWTEQDGPAAYYRRVYVRLGGAEESDIACEFDECSGIISRNLLWWSRDGREVLFRRVARGPESAGRVTYYAWNIDENAVRKIYVEDSRHLSACSLTDHALICFSDEPAGPRTLVEVQFTDGSVKELFDPNPQFDEILVGDVERIEWVNKFGFGTFGWIVKPIGYEAGKRYPLVIIQSRASVCFKGGSGYEYPSQLFAAEGFVVLCVRQNASPPGDGSPWKDYPYFDQNRGRAATLDSAIDALDEKGLIDPTRVGVTGLSGGMDGISYALSHENKFGAVIGAGFPWAPVAYYSADTKGRARGRRWGFGRPGSSDDKKLWSEMSPGMNPSKVYAPILIQVSDDEAHNAMFNYVTLKEEGKAIDMYVFKDEYHIKWHPRNRKAVAIRAVDWMRFWLKGEEDSDPIKAEQYARWFSTGRICLRCRRFPSPLIGQIALAL